MRAVIVCGLIIRKSLQLLQALSFNGGKAPVGTDYQHVNRVAGRSMNPVKDKATSSTSKNLGSLTTLLWHLGICLFVYIAEGGNWYKYCIILL